MKCIVYVSRVVSRKNGATVPAGLSKIFGVARKANALYGVTGVLSYRKGYYIQVIEGEDAAVDQLLKNISEDLRHENVTVILNQAINKRSFADWDMKLLESVGKDPSFLDFIEKNASLVIAMPADHRALLEHFLRPRGASNKNSIGYAGTELQLLAWPDFTEFSPSPVLIELCARLTKKSYSYDALIGSNDFGTKEQVDKILNKFNQAGILKVIASSVQNVEFTQAKNSNGFYSKMKNFLGLR